MDVAGATLGILALSPILLGTAAAIKLTSKGPVLFRQTRVGLDGKPFSILKFRTMYADRGDATGRTQTKENDDRVTPVGRFIRASSIDELPQLLNVLKGDMSLVGPRPHVPGMIAADMPYDTLVPYYGVRHSMKPGITGWAQANGFRGPTVSARPAIGRIDHDVAYLQNFSLWLDVKILALTVWREFRCGGTGF